MVFTTERFFEVAIESWPEWDLNPRPVNSVPVNGIVGLPHPQSGDSQD